MRWFFRVSMGLACALFGVGGLAFALDAPTGTGCTKTAVVDATADTGRWGVVSEVSANPIRICSASFISSYGTNGWAQVFESPSTTDETHGQAVTKAEPGSATQYNSAHEFFGDHGRYTRFGVGARVVRGRLTVHYQD